MRAVLLGLILLLAVGARAEVTSPHWPLKQVFQKNAAVIQLGNQGLAEVCEGEECTRFVIAGDNTIELVHDFAFLYCWLVKDYDLAPYKGADGKRFLETILARRKGSCTGADEEAIGRCVLARMASTYRVSALVNKFEDGWRKTFPLDLAGELRKAKIIP